MKIDTAIEFINRFGIKIDSSGAALTLSARDVYRKFKDTYQAYFCDNNAIVYYFWSASWIFDKFELDDKDNKFYFSIKDLKVEAFKHKPNQWENLGMSHDGKKMSCAVQTSIIHI